jgi:hypothetical protein
MDYDSGQGHYQAMPVLRPAPGMAAGAQYEVIAEGGHVAGWIGQQTDGTFVVYLPSGHRFCAAPSLLSSLAHAADLDEDGRESWELARAAAQVGPKPQDAREHPRTLEHEDDGVGREAGE